MSESIELISQTMYLKNIIVTGKSSMAKWPSEPH